MMISRRINPEREERGVALILVIEIGFVIFLLLNAWLISIQGRSHFLNLRREKLQAFYTAEAGLSRAIWTLKQSPDYRTQNPPRGDTLRAESLFTKGLGKCRISVMDRGKGAEITAIGFSGRTSRTLKALMVVQEKGKIKRYHFFYYKPMGRKEVE